MNSVGDTFTLLLNLDMGDGNGVKITKPELFDPHADILKNNRGARSLQCRYIGTTYGYFPTVTLSKALRKVAPSFAVKVQFSAPKLKYDGCNLEEISDEDFEFVVDELHKKLHIMGIEATKDMLRYAKVVRVDYGKNIPTSISPLFLISHLSKAEIRKTLDATKCSFRNDGMGMHWLSKHLDITLYDKFYEINRSNYSPSRSINPENAQNLDLSTIKHKNWLRLEVRLASSSQIRESLAKVGITLEELSFKNLFCSDICQKVNCYYWDLLMNGRKALHLSQDSIKDVFKSFVAQDMKPIKALQIVGLMALLKEISIRELTYYTKGKTATIRDLLKKLKESPPDVLWLERELEEIKQIIMKNKCIKL